MKLWRSALERERIQPAGPTYGLNDERSDGRIDVVSPTDEITTNEVTTRDRQAASRAATPIREGSMETVIDSCAILDRWIQAADEQPVGFSCEVYLDCPEDQADWGYRTPVRAGMNRLIRCRHDIV